MAAKHATDDDLVAEINVTPFVDVVLVLLVVLMVTSTQIARTAIDVKLPRAASAGQVTAPTLNIVLSEGGALRVDGALADRSTLRALIARRRLGAPRLQVAIAAHRHVPYESVIGLIDAVKQGGVAHFALNVEPTR